MEDREEGEGGEVHHHCDGVRGDDGHVAFELQLPMEEGVELVVKKTKDSLAEVGLAVDGGVVPESYRNCRSCDVAAAVQLPTLLKI